VHLQLDDIVQAAGLGDRANAVRRAAALVGGHASTL
jgi:hypothetical protein